MTNLFKVEGQTLTPIEIYPAVSDTVNYLTFLFTFSFDWDGLTKSAIFTKGDDVYEVVLTNDEVLESDHVNLSAGVWEISVVGDTVVDAVVTRQITTSSYNFNVTQSSATSGGVFPPSVASQVYVNVNQATPQTFVGGIPKLAADRTITHDNELTDKKFVENKVAEITADDFSHNDLSNIQGGTAGEYYHTTQAQNAALHAHSNKAALDAVSGTNTGDQDAAGVANTPAGNIAATTVQAAINELDTEKEAVANKVTSISETSTDTQYPSAKCTYDAISTHNTDAGAHASLFAAGTASPAGTYANLAALIAADPDHTKIYLTLDDGKWCYHNGSAWVAGGVYQTLMGVDATLIKDGYAADSKTTGDRLYSIESGSNNLQMVELVFENGVYNASGTKTIYGATPIRCFTTPVVPGEKYLFDFCDNDWTKTIVWKNSVGTVLSTEKLGDGSSFYPVYAYAITVPENAYEMCANSLNGAVLRKVVFGEIDSRKDETIIREWDDISDTAVIVTGKKYQNKTGSLIASNNSDTNIFDLTVSEGTYRITASKHDSNPSIYVDGNAVYFLTETLTPAILSSVIIDISSGGGTISGVYNTNATYGDTTFSIEKLVETEISDYAAQFTVDINATNESSAICIAASDAPAAVKSVAAVVCTGTNDEVAINAVIQSLPATGGEIKLSSGLFKISNQIIIDRPVKITGEGPGIAGIPAYTPTNGNTYENLYGGNVGITTIRVVADVVGIEISAAYKIRGIVIRDLILQGYGKDRHTKAGIQFTSETDLTFMENVSVTDCYVGLYAWGDGKLDAANILNCSFQWCGLGAMLHGIFGRITGCCIADNNGISSFGGLPVNCGGLVLRGTSFCATGNQIIRPTRYAIQAGNPGCGVLLYNLRNSLFSENTISETQGNCVDIVDGAFITISNNFILNAAKAVEAGYKNSISMDSNSSRCIFTGNKIGKSYGNAAILPVIDYGIKSLSTSGYNLVTGNYFYCVLDDVSFNESNSVTSNNIILTE